jgi:hypothetical protein
LKLLRWGHVIQKDLLALISLIQFMHMKVKVIGNLRNIPGDTS